MIDTTMKPSVRRLAAELFISDEARASLLLTFRGLLNLGILANDGREAEAPLYVEDDRSATLAECIESLPDEPVASVDEAARLLVSSVEARERDTWARMLELGAVRKDIVNMRAVICPSRDRERMADTRARWSAYRALRISAESWAAIHAARTSPNEGVNK